MGRTLSNDCPELLLYDTQKNPNNTEITREYGDFNIRWRQDNKILEEQVRKIEKWANEAIETKEQKER